jgi:antitoxin component of RelBE/YafQ-DinJ toxin-antitoxin module
MPNQPKANNPARAIRVSDDLWRAAQAKAADKGTTVSEVVRAALERFVKRA